MHHIAIGDDIFLALQPQFPRLARAAFTLERNVILIGDGLGADEALLEIRMNDAAACGAFMPLMIVQARASFGPAVK